MMINKNSIDKSIKISPRFAKCGKILDAAKQSEVMLATLNIIIIRNVSAISIFPHRKTSIPVSKLSPEFGCILMRSLPECIYEFGCFDKAIKKNYVEKLVMDLINRIVSNLRKLPNEDNELSNLDIMDIWITVQRDVSMIYDIFDRFEKVLEIYKQSFEKRQLTSKQTDDKCEK